MNTPSRHQAARRHCRCRNLNNTDFKGRPVRIDYAEEEMTERDRKVRSARAGGEADEGCVAQIVGCWLLLSARGRVGASTQHYK
jgi:hypothetical protein